MVNLLNNPLGTLLRIGDTRLLRLFFSFASMGMVTWILFDGSFKEQHGYLLLLTNSSVYTLGFAYSVHAILTLHGVFINQFVPLLTKLEVLLGWILWTGGGIAEAVQEGAPGPMLLSGGLLATFLLIRYPSPPNERI